MSIYDQMKGNNDLRAAFIHAMSTAAMIEAMGMQALNQYRLQRGETPAYDDSHFSDVVEKYLNPDEITQMMGEDT